VSVWEQEIKRRALFLTSLSVPASIKSRAQSALAFAAAMISAVDPLCKSNSPRLKHGITQKTENHVAIDISLKRACAGYRKYQGTIHIEKEQKIKAEFEDKY
jgi:hypothetical protein